MNSLLQPDIIITKKKKSCSHFQDIWTKVLYKNTKAKRCMTSEDIYEAAYALGRRGTWAVDRDRSRIHAGRGLDTLVDGSFLPLAQAGIGPEAW